MLQSTSPLNQYTRARVHYGGALTDNQGNRAAHPKQDPGVDALAEPSHERRPLQLQHAREPLQDQQLERGQQQARGKVDGSDDQRVGELQRARHHFLPHLHTEGTHRDVSSALAFLR